MEASSNIDDVSAWLDAIVAGIDFSIPGRDQSLGRDLAGVVAEGIADRSVPDAVGPDGGEWPENKEPYRSRKAKKYDAHQTGILTGQMLSLESLLGETTIGADEVEMRYGTGRPAERARNGARPPASRNPATDREKAGYCEDMGIEFYALDDAIADACVDETAGAVDGYLAGH